jgi:DNA topoisomerase-3
LVFGVAVYLDGESATFFILAAINTEKAREEIFMQLVVTEKPSVAQAIARVIGACERKDGYMEGNGYIVSWCIGHLVELAQPDAYSDTWKKWSYESLPIIPEEWQTEVKSDTAAQYKVLKGLMHDARVDSVVCATDVG